MIKNARPSWFHSPNPAATIRESVERMDAHSLAISLRGCAAILRDIAATMEEGENKIDVVFVSERLERVAPVIVQKMADADPAKRQKRRGNLTTGARPEYESGTGRVKR